MNKGKRVLAEFGRIAVVIIQKINKGKNYTNIGNLDTFQESQNGRVVVTDIANITDITDIAKEVSKQNFGCRKLLDINL